MRRFGPFGEDSDEEHVNVEVWLGKVIRIR